MKIEYWSDIACPFCYIGVTRMKKALTAIGLGDTPLTMRAFELDPNAPLETEHNIIEHFADKYMVPAAQAAMRIDSIDRMGCEEGLDFHMARTKPVNTFDAHRLVKLAQTVDEPTAARTAELLYRAYMCEGRSVADHDTLIEIGSSAGIAPNAIASMLASPQFLPEVRADEAEAKAREIWGVPYFIIDDAYAISGAQPLDTLIQALREILQA